MAAFETLLELGQQPRKNFKDLIEKYCNLPHDRKLLHYYLDHGRKRRDVNRTMKGKWAESFYQLRNCVVHGERIKGKYFRFREKMVHFDLATIFFIILIKKLMNENLRRKIFDEDIIWNKSEQTFEHVDRFIHYQIMQGLKKEIKETKRAVHRRN